MATPAAILSVLVQAKGIEETNRKLRNIQDSSERASKSTEKLEGRFSRLDATVGDFNRTMTASGNVMKLVKFPAMIAGAGLAAQAIGALSAGAISLGAALAPLAGLAAAGAAGYAAMGQAMGVVKLATAGLDKALTGDKKAIAALSSEQRKFVEVLNGLKPKIKDLQQTAQAGLLPGAATGLKSLLPLFPRLKGVVGDTAKVLGQLAAQAGKMVSGWGPDLSAVGARNVGVIRNIGNAALSAASALKDIIVVGGPLLTWLSKMVATGADWVAQQVAAGRESGKLAGFLERTKSILILLGHVVRDFGVGLFNVFKGGVPLGNNLLGLLEKLAAKFRAWTESVSGQNQIKAYFDAAKAPLLQVFGLIGDVAGALLRISQGKGATGLLVQLRSLVPVLENVVTSTTAAFGPALIDALGNVLRLFGLIAGSSGPLVQLVRLIGLLAAGLTTLLTSVPGLNSMTVSFIGLYGSLKAVAVVFGPLAAAAKAVEVALVGQTVATNLATAATIRERIALAATAVAMYAAAAASKVVTAAQWLLNAALTANPIGLVIVGLAALAAALVIAYKKSETFRNIVNAAWKVVGDATKVLWTIIKTYFGLYVTIITTAWNAIKTVTMTVWHGLSTAAVTVWNGIKTAILTPIRAVRDALGGKDGIWAQLLDTAKGWWDKITSGVGKFATSIANAVKSAFEGAVNKVIDFVNAIIGVVNLIPGVPNIKKIGHVGGSGPGKGKGGPNGTGHLAKGGMVPGAGYGDKVPLHLNGRLAAMVEPGELVSVTNRNATAALMQTNKAIPRFADGGVLSAFHKAAKDVGAPPKSNLALWEAGIVESGLRNLPGGDRDSRGALQIRDATARGMGINNMDPYASAIAFLTRGFWSHGGSNLLASQNPKQSAGWIAQMVQGSGYPLRYDQVMSQALNYVKGYTGPVGGGPGIIGSAVNALNPTDFIKKLPGVSGLPDFLKGTGKYALGKVTGWIKDQVSGLVSGDENVGNATGSVAAAIKLAQTLGFGTPSAGQLTGGDHVAGSLHYAGRAVDFGSAGHSKKQMDSLFYGLIHKFGMNLNELFYDLEPFYIDAHKKHLGQMGGHQDHIHAAFQKGGVVGGGLPFLGSYHSGGVAPREGIAHVAAGERMTPGGQGALVNIEHAEFGSQIDVNSFAAKLGFKIATA